MAPARSFTEQLAIRSIGKDEFITVHKPLQMGNIRNVAFGGCTIGSAIKAAFETIKPGYHLYSLMGQFLAPTQPDQLIHLTVTHIRDTRTFATRLVRASQSLPNGKPGERTVAQLTLDFHAAEPASMIEVSTPPMAPLGTPYPPPEACPEQSEVLADALRTGLLTERQGKAYKAVFTATSAFFDERDVPESIMKNNMRGYAAANPTPQDHLPMHSRTSADYFRSQEKLLTDADRTAALGYEMDGALAGVALAHAHISMHKGVAAASTLDFALRIFVNDFDPCKWLLRELNVVAAGVGRTYVESRVWDEEKRLVCSMTQQTILRPMPADASKL